MFKYFRYFQVYTIIVEREGSFQFNFIYQIKSNERKDDMKIIKQIQVSANTFQKWVKASIPALEDGHWEMFVSHPVTPSEKDNVWTIASTQQCNPLMSRYVISPAMVISLVAEKTMNNSTVSSLVAQNALIH